MSNNTLLAANHVQIIRALATSTIPADEADRKQLRFRRGGTVGVFRSKVVLGSELVGSELRYPRWNAEFVNSSQYAGGVGRPNISFVLCSRGSGSQPGRFTPSLPSGERQTLPEWTFRPRG